MLVQVGLKVVKIGRAFLRAKRINQRNVDKTVCESYADL